MGINFRSLTNSTILHLCHLCGLIPWSLCGGLWQTLSWKRDVRRRWDSWGERQVQLCPRLQRGVLPGLHRRLLQQSEEWHLLTVHRYVWAQTGHIAPFHACEESDEQRALWSLNSSFVSSCRMPFILQNLYWSNQSRLWWVQRRLGGGRPGSLCW